jgi:hypothetical protein
MPEIAEQESPIYAAFSKAYSEAQAPRPKLREMIDALEAVIVQKCASARVVAAEFDAGMFSKETLREIASLDAAQELLKRILVHVPRWDDKTQAVIRGDPPKDGNFRK